jgi:hypothetical protein
MVLSTINVSSNMDLETKQQFVNDVIAECEKVLGENSGNRCAKYCKEYLDSKDGQDLDAKGKHQVCKFIHSRSIQYSLGSFQMFV